MIIITLLAMTAHVSLTASPDVSTPGPGNASIQYYKGYNWLLDEAGDSIICYYLTDLYVYPELKFRTQKEREQYDRLVRNVKLTLPYAKLIAETLIETYEYIETFPTQKERDEYMKRMEKEIFKQYKPVLKKFSKTQARVLVKLVQRETHQSSYNIVKAFLGTFRAAFWQGFGQLFGVSLKSKYNPDHDAEDGRIERIATQVELGIL